jgi:hypothetical protein
MKINVLTMRIIITIHFKSNANLILFIYSIVHKFFFNDMLCFDELLKSVNDPVDLHRCHRL